MKTKERCQLKSSLDYFDRQWPCSSNILDTIRCSVSFSSSKDLINGVNKIKQLIGFDDVQIGYGCLYKVVRIKNMFGDIKNWDFKRNLNDDKNNDNEEMINDFSYCDLKMNVIVKHDNIAIIGEIQFMLDWMVDAKSMGHIHYGFLRNEYLYRQLAEKLEHENNVDIKEKTFELVQDCGRKDYYSLSKLVLIGTIDKLTHHKSHNFDFKHLLTLCEQGNWSKGLKLLNCLKDD